jgi:hypothetical protein
MARGKTTNPKSANKDKPRAFNDNFGALLTRAKCVAALKKEWNASPFQKYYEEQPVSARKMFLRQLAKNLD